MPLTIEHQKITLDVNENCSSKILKAHQGDKGTRYIDVTLVASGQPIMLTSGYTAVVSASVNGVTKAINDCTIDTSNQIVTVELTDIMLDTAGELLCDLSLIENNKRVTSATFTVLVQPSTVADESEITASTEYGALTAALTSIQDVADKAELVQGLVDDIADLQQASDLINKKVDYLKLTGDVELNQLNGSTFSPMTECIIYNLYGVQNLGHAPVVVTNGFRGYVVVSRQNINDVVTVEQELHLLMIDRAYPGGYAHHIYTRCMHPDISGTHWSGWTIAATSIDIANLQRQIDNLPTGGVQLSGNVSFSYNGTTSSIQGTGVTE